MPAGQLIYLGMLSARATHYSRRPRQEFRLEPARIGVFISSRITPSAVSATRALQAAVDYGVLPAEHAFS